MLKIPSLLCFLAFFSSCIFNQNKEAKDSKDIWVLESTSRFWNDSLIANEKLFIGNNGIVDSSISTDFRYSTSRKSYYYYSNSILDSIITKSIDGYYSKVIHIYDSKGKLIELKSNDSENASTPIIQFSYDELKNIKEEKHLTTDLKLMYQISYYYNSNNKLDSTKEYSLWNQNDTKRYTYMNDTTICKTFSNDSVIRTEKTIISNKDSLLTKTTSIIDDTLITILSEIKDNNGNKSKEIYESNQNSDKYSILYYWIKKTI